MTQVEVVARKWGNSIGFTLPKKFVEERGIREGKTMRIQVQDAPHRPEPWVFGGLKGWKIDAQKMKDEARKEHEW